MRNIKSTVPYFRVLVKDAGNGVFLARSADFNIMAQGSNEEEAARVLFSNFIATYLAYEVNGESMEAAHPKAPPIFREQWDRGHYFEQKMKKVAQGHAFNAGIKPMLCHNGA